MAKWPAVLRQLIALAMLAVLTGNAQAQLAPDDRRQLRREMREHWQQLPPDERQRYRQERQERRDHFQQMPAEDRNRLREELRGRREAGDGRNFEHRGRVRH